MTRDRLAHLRASARAYRDSIRRDHAAIEAARTTRLAREEAARRLTSDLHDADVPEGLGFEEGGIVVWWEGHSSRRDHLGHVFLAFYRGEG